MNQSINVIPTSQCMVETIEQRLLQFDKDTLKSVQLVVPTQRLATNIIAKLAKTHNAFHPPQINNIDQFFSSLHTEEKNKSIPQISLEILIASFIKQKKYNHIQIGDEHEIAQFFNDISEMDIKETAFSKLLEINREDQYHSNEHTNVIEDRFLELQDLYKATSESLRQHHQKLHADTMTSMCEEIFNQFDITSLKLQNPVIFVGFTTIKPYYFSLVEKLIDHKLIEFWVSHPPELYSAENPLNSMIKSIYKPWSSTPKTLESENTFVLESSNILEESNQALHLAEQFIKQGVPPSQIAILLTNEGLHGKPIRSLMKSKDFEANIAIASPLSQTVIGSWLQTLIQYIFQEEQIDDLLHLALHPINLNWYHNKHKKINTLSEFKAQISYQLLNQTEVSNYRSIIKNCNIEISDYVTQMNVLITESEFIQKSAQPLDFWIESLEKLFESFDIFSKKNHKELDLASSIKNTINQFLQNIRASIDFVNPNLTPKEFKNLFLDKLLAEDIRQVGYPLKGVQILSLIESRYIPFSVTIILGCTEGNFPKALPADRLVDEWFKTRLGLPGWKYVESLEDTTFNLLKARLPQLILSYSQTELESPTVRSRFIETLLSEDKKRLLHTEAAPLSAYENLDQSLLDIILKQKSQKIGIFHQDRNDFLNSMSATALEKLITCPYKFILSRLKVDPLQSPIQKTAMEEGEWLHAILEAFFTGKHEDKELLTPFNPTIKDDFHKIGMERLNTLTRLLLPKGYLQGSLYSHLMDFAWPKFLVHLESIISQQSLLSYHKEFKISKKHNPSYINIGNQKISIVGSVDSINIFQEIALITDYKRNSIPLTKKVGQGLSPQLTLYAKALENLDKQEDRVEMSQILTGYWSVLKGKWEGVSVGESIKSTSIKLNLAKKKTVELEEAWSHLKSLWEWRHKNLFENNEDFLPDPNPDDWCLYCQHKGICRIDDPAQDILALTKLSKRLTEQEKKVKEGK